MTQTLRLHYAPDNASLCVRLALLELGLPFETALLDRQANAQNAPEYLAINPNGLIPALETPDGPIFETAAILLWLADRQPGTLCPAPTDPGRGNALKWLFWLSNTLHPALRLLFYPGFHIGPSGADQERLRTRTRERISDLLDILAAAPDAPWLDAEAPSIHACYLAPMLRWPAIYGGRTDWYDLGRWPRLLAFAQRFENRPAAIAAALAEGLGPCPFSAPVHPTPPEGSAT